jgi:isocitrate dehydrogenase
MATLFAWTGALRKRGELDGCIELARFSERLERSAEQAINNGVMTGDLAKLSDHPGKRVVTSAEFLGEVRSRLEDPRTDV